MSDFNLGRKVKVRRLPDSYEPMPCPECKGTLAHDDKCSIYLQATPPQGPRDFDKVDRALEIAVIDWLQWGEFPERLDKPSMPALALELIAKRKAAQAELEQRLAEAQQRRDQALAEVAQLKHLLASAAVDEIERDKWQARATRYREALEQIDAEWCQHTSANISLTQNAEIYREWCADCSNWVCRGVVNPAREALNIQPIKQESAEDLLRELVSALSNDMRTSPAHSPLMARAKKLLGDK